MLQSQAPKELMAPVVPDGRSAEAATMLNADGGGAVWATVRR